MEAEQKQNVFISFLNILLNRGERVAEALDWCDEIVARVDYWNPTLAEGKVLKFPRVEEANGEQEDCKPS